MTAPKEESGIKMRYLYILLCAALLLSLCACTAAPQPTDAPTDPPTQAEPVTEPATEPPTEAPTEPETTADEFPTAVLSDYSDGVYVCVTYPVLPSATANAAIEAFVKEMIAYYCPEADTTTLKTEAMEHPPEMQDRTRSLELSGRVTFQSDELVCVVLEGMHNVRTAAHPNHLFSTRNFDPQTGETIRFSDRYVIDEALYEAFAASAVAFITERADGGTWPKGWGSFAEMFCDEEEFINGLTAEEEYHALYTEDGLYISFPVAYALGGHMEVPIPDSALTPIS